MCYSKPIGSILLADFASLNPQLLPAVPRVFEAVYEGVNRAMRKTGGVKFILFKFFVAVGVLQSKIDRVMFRKTAFFAKRVLLLDWLMFIIPWLILTPVKALGGVLVFKKIRVKLGNAFTGGVSGGGALPPAVDQFYWAVGINIVEGYGLTETAPVVSVRPMKKPVFGTVGKPIRGVEVKITGENGEILPPGTKGTVKVRGGIVMKGYYKKDDLTAKAIDKDGWLDTGDLGMMTINGELVLRGRMKDTIVLRGGENVEPLPIEMRLKECRFIGQCVVVGQDERYLSALIVPAQEEVENFAKENSIAFSSYGELLSNPEIVKMFDTEIQNLVNSKSGFKIFEKVARFALLKKPFEVGVELSAKQEIMRYKLPELYAKEMKALYK
jgi:long-chain acyl-CoA synthetase